MATLTDNKTFPTSISINESTRSDINNILNQRLADSLDLKLQTKHAHWNVKGPNFQQLHELFDLIAPHFDDAADLLAERVTQLGGVAHGTARLVAAASSIPEYDLDAVDGTEHLKSLISRLGKFANQVRQDIDRVTNLGDAGTADILTELSRQADKDLWFLEAHLQR